MKKLLALTTLLAVSVPAMANTVSTVAQAKRTYDNARFAISGQIVSQVDQDEFIFKDATGSIRIDLDDDIARRVKVGDRIRINGEVDVDDDSGRRSLDVDYINR